MEKSKYLLIELTESPQVWLSSKLPDDAFILNETEYYDSGSGDFVGFYDYLRNGQNEILGVRIQPFKEFGLPEETIIFFSAQKDVDETKSDDQLFGDNKLFKSNDNEVLLTFRAPDENLVANNQVSSYEIIEITPQAA